MKLEPAARIPEERVAEILTRAAELDRDRRETITVDAIRSAALDAGISLPAVEAALEEYAARAVARSSPAREREGRFGRLRGVVRRVASALKTPLRLGAAMFVVGLAGAAGEGMVIIGWLLWLALLGRAVLKLRPARRATPFVLRLPALVLGSGIIKVRFPRRFRASRGELRARAG